MTLYKFGVLFSVVAVVKSFCLMPLKKEWALLVKLYNQKGSYLSCTISHSLTHKMTYLHARFGNVWVISKNFLTIWSPYSLDLYLCNFWLWEFLKDHVYIGSIQTLLDLKTSITSHNFTIWETCCATVKHVLHVNGMHIEHMLFYINKILCLQFQFFWFLNHPFLT